MQREKAKKNQIVVAMSILLLFLFSFIISGFPVYARSPVVVIQPGHSVGYDPGATNSSTGITEAAVNAAVAGKVATKLKQLGYTVYLTHPVAGCSVQSLLTNAEANSLSNVANAINKIKPDLAISVHHNSGGSSASGYEFYWSSYRDFDQEGVYEVSGLWAGDTAFRDSSPCWAAQESKVFASVLERNFNGIGINHRKTVERDDYVQAHVTCPSVLIEGGFISNPSESLLLASDAFQEKMSGRIVNSVSEYFGGATKDEKAPTADSITTPESPTTNAVFTVTANGVKDDLSGVRDVRVAIWSFENGQDDLRWYPAQNDGQGNWSAKINIKDHNNEVGYYAAHFYATDNTGNDGFLGGVNVFVTVDGNIPKGMSSKILSSNQFKAYLKGYENYSDILFPVWSADNGQDDLVWYSGIRQTDGSYAVVINNKDHGYDVGKYYVHSYGTDSNGKQVLLGTTEVNVPQMTAGSVEASEVKDGQFTVSVKNLNAPSGIKEILIPVWSANNAQDDLIWHAAQRQSDGSYKATVSLKDHGYDVGKYYVHSYGTDSNGKQVLLGTTEVNVPQMTAGSVEASEVKDGQFTVSVKNLNAPSGIKEILIPVWSANNAQDDLIWHAAQRQSDGSYKATVSLKDHGYDVGKYYVHSYGTDSNGKQVLLGTTEVNVPQMTAGSVEASEVKDGQFTVSVKNLNAPSGIKEILIPVWSANNAQDDLIWHAAQRQSDGSYKATVSLKDHGYDVGKYYVHSYGTDSNGKQVLLGTTEVNVTNNDVPDITEIEFSTSTSIMGIQTNTAQELADYFNSKAAFPSSFYGMPAVEFANIYIEECKTEGVRPEVAFAQMCLETGYLQYGGDVKREQFNFAGIGATGNGAPGNSFADVRTGIRAQVQHLKAYASTEGLVNECVDPRYQYVNKGCAPTVGDLAGKWAADVNYGNKLVTVMNAF
ncbi:GBS Bsp-like repeat-containing protein [Eubacterium callanderi]|uniref:GBS Bsp-like repeat-containing protein n=1 Tax=Eubacterium callanderi TaxID=53442 RepID=UPI003992420A